MCSGGLCRGKIGAGLEQIARGGPSHQAQLSKEPGHLSLSQGVEVGGGDRGVTGPVRPISGLAADSVPPGAMHVLLEAAARVTGKEEADR